MKKLTLVLSTCILLVACSSDNSSEKGASKIENTSNQSIKDIKEPSNERIIKSPESNKVKTDDFDISSKEFIHEYTKATGKGFRGIEPGITFAEAKEKLGNPTSYSIDGMPAFGGFRVYFNNFILVFDEAVKIKSDLKDNSKVKYIFLQSKNSPKQQEFEKQWGTTNDVAELGAAGSIVSLSYDINNTKVDAFYSHGIIEYVTKENLLNINEERNKNTSTTIEDINITKVNDIAHYNYPKIDTYEYGQEILSNRFNIFGYYAGDDAGDLIEKLGNYKEVTEYEPGVPTYLYDNFAVTIKNGKVHSYTLKTEDLSLSSNLLDIWQVKPEPVPGDVALIDGIKNNGYYVEVYSTTGPNVGISAIGITGENYNYSY